MGWLLAGLLIFLGAHSVRIFAEDWRSAVLARIGPQRWKAAYSIVSLAGFALIVWGYALARADPIDLWMPPAWARPVAAVLSLAAFVLVAAAYIPGNRIKAALGHPMIVGVKLWAFAHLLANGRLADAVLFGAFLAWAVLDFRAARRRDRSAGTRYRAAAPSRDVATLVAGLAAGWAFAHYLHGWLIGVRPWG